jgi:hypothetical protein
MFVKLFLLPTFVGAFFTTFSTDLNQREILLFLIVFLIFFPKKLFWVILALFAIFDAERAKNRSKNQKTYLVHVS